MAKHVHVTILDRRFSSFMDSFRLTHKRPAKDASPHNPSDLSKDYYFQLWVKQLAENEKIVQTSKDPAKVKAAKKEVVELKQILAERRKQAMKQAGYDSTRDASPKSRGAEAAKQGRPQRENPFEKHSDEYMLWNEGYNTAKTRDCSCGDTKDAPLKKFTKGQVVRVRGAGVWSGGKEVPHQKIVVADPRPELHKGEPTILIDIYYGPEEVRKYHVNPIEHSWAYLDDVS